MVVVTIPFIFMEELTSSLLVLVMTLFILEPDMTSSLVEQVMTPLTVEMELISLSSRGIRLIIPSLHLSLVYMRGSQFQEQMVMTLSPI